MSDMTLVDQLIESLEANVKPSAQPCPMVRVGIKAEDMPKLLAELKQMRQGVRNPSFNVPQYMTTWYKA